MNVRRHGAPRLALFALALLLAGPFAARAQEESQGRPAPRREEVNHEVQVFLLTGSNDAAQRGQLPESLNGVVRQLRAALPYGGYRLSTTFFNRVRDGASFELRGVGASPLSAMAPSSGNPLIPTFYNYMLGSVRLGEDPSGAKFIHIRPLRFGLKVPVQTGSTRTGDPGTSTPTIQYEDTGLTTEISVREGEPTVVGTITTSRADEIFVLVITAKRTGAR